MRKEVVFIKRKETLEIEEALRKETEEKRIYGCEEITIGFYNSGHGNEVVDFMTMDSKGIIRCYEIKVTLQDLKSDAKKSWYGNYNYLVVSKELYDQVSDWKKYLPENVGLIVAREGCEGRILESAIKTKKINISVEDSIMLKESMVRSIFYKMKKYRSYANETAVSKLRAENKKLSKRLERYINQENDIWKLCAAWKRHYHLSSLPELQDIIQYLKRKE